MSDSQEKYWHEMEQLRIHATYVGYYYEKTIQIDRKLQIYLALASSGGIAGWAVFDKKYSFIWAIFVAGSQVIHAIKYYLPYSKRLKALNSITGELESLFLSMEERWFDVSEGKLTEEEIHKLYINFKKQKNKILKENLHQIDLPHDERLMKNAIESATQYIQNYFM